MGTSYKQTFPNLKPVFLTARREKLRGDILLTSDAIACGGVLPRGMFRRKLVRPFT